MKWKLLGKKIWLPKRLAKLALSRKHFNQIIRISFKLEKWLEKVSKPRLRFLTSQPLSKTFHLLVIAISGLLLALPLPIPLTNFYFGWIILLTSIGHLMNDGLFIMIADILLLLLIILIVSIVR